MSALVQRVKNLDGSLMWMWFCPGCVEGHWADDRWTFNGNEDAPTFTPSVLVRDVDGSTFCHSFVRDGKIEFLGDCKHALAGKTVALEPW